MGDQDSERTSYHHGNLRQELLELALAQVEASGVDALSLRDLASRLGVSKTAPYRHFTDKPALLRALMDVGWGQLRRVLLEASATESDPVAGLRAMGRAYLAFATRRSNLYRLLFSGRGHELFPDVPCSESQDAFAPVVDQIERCQRSGWKVGIDPQILALSIWAHVHGAAELCIEGLGPVPAGVEPHEFWSVVLETSH